jgi:Na+/glutamate symporter
MKTALLYGLGIFAGVVVRWFIARFLQKKAIPISKTRALGDFAGFLILAYSILAIVWMVMGKSSLLQLASPWVRVFLCFSFLFWSLTYYLYQETAWSILFGLFQIIGATASNWYQLTRLADPHQGLQHNLYDRLVFIAAGIAVTAKGWKDIEKGAGKFAERVFTPRSSGSSATQGPAPRDH